MKKDKLILIFAGFAATVAFSACKETEIDGGKENTDNPAIEILVDPRGEGYEVGEVKSIDEYSLAELTSGQLAFARQSFSNLTAANPQTNYVYSPLSLYMVMTATGNGACGTTVQEIESALGVKAIEDAVALCRYQLDEFAKCSVDFDKWYNDLERFMRVSGGLTEDEIEETVKPLYNDRPTIGVANSLWHQPGFKPFDSYISESMKWLDTEIKEAELTTPEGIGQINEWVSDNTGGLVERLFSEPLNSQEVLTIINTVYLKLKWLVGYSEDNTDEYEFHNVDGTTSMVKKLHNIEGLQFAENSELMVVSKSLGSQDEVATYDLIFPKSATTPVTELMSNESVDALIASQESRRVDLTMPGYECELAYDNLHEVMQQMGVRTMFDPTLADFSRMGTPGMLSIGKMIQKTTLKVTEKGVEAAAATANVAYGDNLKPKPEPIVIVVDRPFGFRIRHIGTGAVLFMGEINKL